MAVSLTAESLKDLPPYTKPFVLSQVPPRPAPGLKTSECAAHLTLEDARLPRVQDVGHEHWRTVVQCDAHTPSDAWQGVMESFVRHPEVNSSNILRADILADVLVSSTSDDGGSTTPWRVTRRILRRLLPRKPGVNSHIDQLCTFCSDATGRDRHLVIYTPLLGPSTPMQDTMSHGSALDAYLQQCHSPLDAAAIPFFHPRLLAMSFQYEAVEGHGAATEDLATHAVGTLSVGVLPLPALGVSTQIERVCTSLLTTIHRHSWGRHHNYKARMQHDRLAQKEVFQDVYLNLKHRWAKYIVANWQEGTDAEKHVHEDVALAAWLMCFWRQRFGSQDRQTPVQIGLQRRPWLTDHESWPRPPGGFVDVGCGNGLLVWLLTNEGYAGLGFDLRPRKSWALWQRDSQAANSPVVNGQPVCTIAVEYPSANNGTAEVVDVEIQNADLRVHTLAPLRAMQQALEAQEAPELSVPADAQAALFPPGCFLIGNHADELTPLLPLLASILVPSCSGMMNMPCCPFTVAGERFGRSHYRVSREEVATLLGYFQPYSETETSLEASTLDQRQSSLEEIRKEMVEIGLGPPVDPPKAVQPKSRPSNLSHPEAQDDVTVHAVEGGSKNVAYLTYVSHLHLMAGWHIEKEAIRIPSTKNWTIVSTRRVASANEGNCGVAPSSVAPTVAVPSRKARVESEVRKRLESLVFGASGTWKARDPRKEGKWFLTQEGTVDEQS
ncbi:unnamed protein product [Parajaminaea phylloscopi]